MFEKILDQNLATRRKDNLTAIAPTTKLTWVNILLLSLEAWKHKCGNASRKCVGPYSDVNFCIRFRKGEEGPDFV